MKFLPIIGLGAVCAAGADIDAACEALAVGFDGIKPLQDFPTGLKTPPLCAQVTAHLDPAAPNRTTGLALMAAQQALAHTQIAKSGLRMGMVFATTVAGITRSEAFYRSLTNDTSTMAAAAKELAFHEPGACAGWLCARLGLHGLHTLSTACSTGLHAVGLAKRMIDAGKYDVCCAIGADALSILTVRGFASLLLVDPNGCRPFDRRRAGISLGEGAGAVLLASTAAARRLGVSPLAYAAGWGASADGRHMTAPHPEGRGAAEAVRMALDEAAISPDRIDLIAAHGTGTPDNDAAEIKAMRAVFKDGLPPFCSMKRTLGHTLAASGALETALAVACMRRAMIPPTAGYEEADDAIGAAPSPCVKRSIRCILKNSFGFGGNNAAMVFASEAEA